MTGLVVGGEVYDVDFVGNISSNDWLSMLDFTTFSDANEVAATLAAALNDAGATAVPLETSIGTLFDDARNIAIPYGVDDNRLVTANTQRLLSSQSWTLLTNSFGLSDSTYPFAMGWTPAVVPVPLPAALPFLLGELAGLLLVGRRKPA